MRAQAPDGYRLDLSGDEPLYVLDEDDASVHVEEGGELSTRTPTWKSAITMVSTRTRTPRTTTSGGLRPANGRPTAPTPSP
ncbi:MAG: hypothetical protein M5U18_19570 [Dehalococcoidia bacterium]|nr:hypothetical protein [Dehalococcoidia bacterium]